MSNLSNVHLGMPMVTINCKENTHNALIDILKKKTSYMERKIIESGSQAIIF